MTRGGLIGFFQEDLKDSQYLKDRFLVRLDEEIEEQRRLKDTVDNPAVASVFQRMSKPVRLFVATNVFLLTLSEIMAVCKKEA